MCHEQLRTLYRQIEEVLRKCIELTDDGVFMIGKQSKHFDGACLPMPDSIMNKYSELAILGNNRLVVISNSGDNYNPFFVLTAEELCSIGDFYYKKLNESYRGVTSKG